MATPSQLIRMAERNSRLRKLYRTRQTDREEELTAKPLPTRHAAYSSLMRSHDRMGTRHLSKNGT